MAYLLHIESTSTVCSVALSNDNQLIAIKEINNGFSHAENLHVFIYDLLKESNIKSNELQAISVSSGPGSYTGLRIGFSAAKGLAYALKIPLVTIDTLQALSASVLNQIPQNALLCPMIDARRMEVYCAQYDASLTEILSLRALILSEESITQLKQTPPVYYFGDGMPKAKTLIQTFENAHFIENITASASSMIELAYKKYLAKDFADVAYTEPNYLKEFFFTSSKK